MANRVALSVQVGAKASRIRVLNTWKLSLLRLHSSRSLVLFQQCCSLLFQQRRPFELMMCAQHLESHLQKKLNRIQKNEPKTHDISSICFLSIRLRQPRTQGLISAHRVRYF